MDGASSIANLAIDLLRGGFPGASSCGESGDDDQQTSRELEHRQPPAQEATAPASANTGTSATNKGNTLAGMRCMVDIWTPRDDFLAIEREHLVWHPAGAREAFTSTPPTILDREEAG